MESLDFRLPEIIPVAAYQALLALKWMADTPLRRREKIELRQYLHHLVETDEIKNIVSAPLSNQMLAQQMMANSGITQLAHAIQARMQPKQSNHFPILR